MTTEEQTKAYALDELLHTEGKPWEWWQLHIRDDWWEDCLIAPTPDTVRHYRRKSDAPDWDRELSLKEVRECEELPPDYGKNIISDIDWMLNQLRGYRVWNKEKGFCDFCTFEIKQELLDHFKKLREEKLK